MESVKPKGNIVDPDWIPRFEFHTSSRRKRKRLVVMKGMLRNEKPPWGFRYLPKAKQIPKLTINSFGEEQRHGLGFYGFSFLDKEDTFFKGFPYFLELYSPIVVKTNEMVVTEIEAAISCEPPMSVGIKKNFDRFLGLCNVVSGDPGNSGSCKRKRQMHDFSSQIEATPSMDRARIVQENLDGRYPSFVKPMIPSNVTGGFWLSLPKPFCNLHLPKRDTVYLLVDGKGQEYNVKYLADRMGFSGGWRGFSIAHKLLEGDVLVFHFVGNYKVKVYIVRGKSLDKVDAALALLHLSAQLPKMDSDCVEKDIRRINQAGEKQARPVPQVLTQSFEKDSETALNDQFGMALPKSDSTRLGLVVLEGLILETTSISDADGCCMLTTSSDEFAYCDKSLKQLRAIIGFRNARLNWLLYLATTARQTSECRNYTEALIERDRGNEESTLEVQMPKLNEAIDRLYAEIDALKAIHT